MKKAKKVAQWRAIRTANTEPPKHDVCISKGKEKFLNICKKEINMSETYLGWYAQLQLFLILMTRNGSL